MVVYQIRFSDKGSDSLDCGKDCFLFSAGMPDQYFVKEPEPLDRSIAIFLSLCCPERCGIDMLQITPERIVKRSYCINRFCHTTSRFPPCVL